MKLETLPLPGLVLIAPTRLNDSRGYFAETFKDEWFRKTIADVDFVQENESVSTTAGTVRGLHFQLDPFAQGKLVRCTAGRVFDVAVDIRSGSPTYGKWHGLELSMENGHQLWIPAGFAHGFATLEPDSTVSYKVTASYSAVSDRGILWTDPAIGIVWPMPLDKAILSDKDKVQPLLADLPPAFEYHV